MSHQLDITYIMRRLIFMDSAISKLLEQHEVEALCLRDKPSLEEAKQTRKTHFALEMFKKAAREMSEGLG